MTLHPRELQEYFHSISFVDRGTVIMQYTVQVVLILRRRLFLLCSNRNGVPAAFEDAIKQLEDEQVEMLRYL